MNEKLYALLDSVKKTAVQAGNAASNVAYLAGKQAGAMREGAKLNLKIMSLKGDVEDALQAVGAMVYATHTGGADNSDALMAKLQEIDELHAQIAALEVEAGKATIVRTCPTCGAEARETDAYCRECGGKL